jgi:hypothetical protein
LGKNNSSIELESKNSTRQSEENFNNTKLLDKLEEEEDYEVSFNVFDVNKTTSKTNDIKSRMNLNSTNAKRSREDFIDNELDKELDDSENPYGKLKEALKENDF